MTRTLRTFGFLLLSAVIGTAVGCAATVVHGPTPARAGSAGDPVITGCVIRFSTATPAIYTNAAHLNHGCRSVGVNSNGSLVVKHSTVGPVVSLTVDEDETFTRKGIACGGSGGIGTTIVACYDRDGDRVRVDRIRTAYANLWITWVHAQAAP